MARPYWRMVKYWRTRSRALADNWARNCRSRSIQIGIVLMRRDGVRIKRAYGSTILAHGKVLAHSFASVGGQLGEKLPIPIDSLQERSHCGDRFLGRRSRRGEASFRADLRGRPTDVQTNHRPACGQSLETDVSEAFVQCWMH